MSKEFCGSLVIGGSIITGAVIIANGGAIGILGLIMIASGVIGFLYKSFKKQRKPEE